ncbi:MAG TPA: hypothetical protein VK171_07785 [Fimbriimonas sp.]|nr:hypothetical protein [Fimbriimonas sp.]
MKQVLKYCAMVALFGVLMGSSCPRDDDNPTGLPEQIVFWGKSGTQNALYITEPGSSTNYSKVINVGTTVINARLSPDKFRILWTENNQLKACKYDGTGLVTWPSTLKVLNAEWGEGSDTIIFETLTGQQIRETAYSNTAINNLRYSGVSGLNGTPRGHLFSFFVISNATVHHAQTDGGGEFGWDSEPVGTDVIHPALSFDNDEVAYLAFDGSKYVLRTSNGSGIRTISTSSQSMENHWPPQMLADGSIIATHTESSGPSGYKYILSLFKTDGTTQLISEIVNDTISKSDLNGSGDGVVYTRGNKLFHYYLTNNATYEVGAGLDEAGYGDIR